VPPADAPPAPLPEGPPPPAEEPPADLPAAEGDPEVDQEPDTLVRITESGTLVRAPSGGPFESALGELVVQEQVGHALTCRVRFALEGVPVEATCPACEPAWQVTFALVSEPEADPDPDADPDAPVEPSLVGDPSRCVDPDLPHDGEVRVWAYSPSDASLYEGHPRLGLWVWWYGAGHHGDEVEFGWSGDVGAAPDGDAS